MRMHKRITSLVGIGFLTAAAGALPADGAAPEKPDPIADAAALVAGQTAFACDLYRQAAQAPGDVVCSPWSLDHALSMTWAGARGTTAAELGRALHVALPAERHHAAHEAQLDRWRDGGGKRAASLNIAAAFWAHPDCAFRPEYLDTLRARYHADGHALSFTDAEAARNRINGWVDERTGGRISDLFPPGVLTPLTRLVLANAVHFRASWQDPFPAHATREAPFHAQSGTDVALPFMRRTGRVAHFAVDGLQWLALPYTGPAVMEIVLPDEGVDLAEIEARLTPDALADWAARATEKSVAISLPRFVASARLPAKDVLRALGVRAAFEPNAADLSGMDGTRELYVQAVVHRAEVAVDEAGTTAAAASGVAIGKRGAARVDATFKADRPFLWWIRDKDDGSILFVGRLAEPAPAR